MVMKIYFAGSIRGGRVDADLYRRIIEYMQQKHDVLTEHVGSPDLNLKEQGKKDIDIYDQDTAWLRESDILIGECTCPSLGVGYELAYAESHGIHVMCSMTEARPSSPPCSPATRISTFTHIHQRRKSFLHLMKY